MSEAAAEMGFQGLDLTVRKNGHVLPKNVVEDLPKAVIAIKKYGMNYPEAEPSRYQAEKIFLDL